MEYDEDIYCGLILKGNLHGAMEYLRGFPEKSELYERYVSLFDRERHIVFDISPELNELLNEYQRYFRDVFYLRKNSDEAAVKHAYNGVDGEIV